MDALLITILHGFFIFPVSTNGLSLFSDYLRGVKHGSFVAPSLCCITKEAYRGWRQIWLTETLFEHPGAKLGKSKPKWS